MIKHDRPLLTPADLIEEPPLPRDAPRIQIDLTHTTETKVTHKHRRRDVIALRILKLITAFWLVSVWLISIWLVIRVAMGQPLLATTVMAMFLIALCSVCGTVSVYALSVYQKTTE